MRQNMDNQQYCTFFVGGLFFGVEVMKVQEVIRYQQLTSVPLAPPEIGGLINLRGQIVTAVRMRKRLGLPDREDDELPMNIVLTGSHGPVSLLVDEIGDVLEVQSEDFEAPPETIADEVRGLITGIFKLEGKLMLVLDTESAITVSYESKTAA
ncbi:MAG: purine-binding chemotaxis protein CheW [Myxococcota bacterium]|jgi:purine-binding chemotaxis protein CheW